MIHVPTNVFCGASELRAWHIFQWSWYHHVLSGWVEIPYIRWQPAYGVRGRGCWKIHWGSWHLLISVQNSTFAMNNSTWYSYLTDLDVTHWSDYDLQADISCARPSIVSVSSIYLLTASEVPFTLDSSSALYLNEVMYHSTTLNCI